MADAAASPAPRLRVATLALAAAGIAVSGYLAYEHARSQSPVCVIGGGGCATVANSRYAELAGIPVAAYGLAMYAFVGVLALVGAVWARAVGFAVVLAGVVFSGYLTVLELFVIDAICPWCVTSALICVALAIVSGVWLRRALAAAAAAPSDRRTVSSAAGAR